MSITVEYIYIRFKIDLYIFKSDLQDFYWNSNRFILELQQIYTIFTTDLQTNTIGLQKGCNKFIDFITQSHKL